MLGPPPEEIEPRRVGESLDRVARRLGAPPVRALGTVFSRWEEAVSPAVADHAWPISLVGGTLVIAVDQAAWATQLRFLAPTIVSRLGELSGTDAVERVEVQVRRRPS